ncbi:MAG: hypothetical protein K2P81_07690 [Bacteriovoracaceae bacterium]|nr:hypothetical protein [Bacteriovoracaceae bacterium]
MRLFLILCFLLNACAVPTRRTPLDPGNQQYGQRPKNVKEFNPIRKKIALLSFFNEAPFGGEDLAIQATEEFRREVMRSKDYLVDPSAAQIFGTSKDIYSGGGVKLAQLTRKAKMAGVNLVVFGRITDARIRQASDEIGFVRKTKALAETKVEIKVFDVISSKELLTDIVDGSVHDDNFRFYVTENEENLAYRQDLLRYSTRVAVRKFLPRLIQIGGKLDWTGRVAKIIGTKIYINAGRDSGVNIGDILKVITEGQDIYDPETGALIGISKGDVKGTLEVMDYFGPDGTIAILHSGGSVTEGDFVQLY